MNLKILLATEGYRTDTNGVACVVAMHAQMLRRYGHEVKVLSLAIGEKSYKEGDDYYLASYYDIVYKDLKKTRVRKHPLIDELNDWKPDIVHAHTEGAAGRIAKAIAYRNNIPLVITSHTDYPKYVFGHFRNFIVPKMIEKVWGIYTYGKADVLILPAAKALGFTPHSFCVRGKRTLYDRLIIRLFLMGQISSTSPAVYNRTRIIIVPNGINLELFRRTVPKHERSKMLKKLGLDENSLVLLTVSRVSKEKRIIDLIRYMRSLLAIIPNVRLVIAGDGPERRQLAGYARKIGVGYAVRFTGRIAPEQIYRIYNIGNIFVSSSDFEVNSISFLEAMASGLPLVCRKDESLKNVLFPGINGYAFVGEKDFCRYIVRLHKDSDMLESMRNEAFKRAESFSSKKFADKMIQIYEKLLADEEGTYG
jgi:1,2-diacylglycerol 3-alpha-glucosyltransferase